MRATITLVLMIGSLTLSEGSALADGCFVFHWNKGIDISEPTQKAIILYDHGREDMVLQVKYDGPAEDFGWLVPVPGLPEVRKASMDCFYELSRLTQQRGNITLALNSGPIRFTAYDSVKVIETKTVGAYEVAILSASDATELTLWLQANNFVFPKDKQDILDIYVKKHWDFVAIKIDPKQNGFVLRTDTPKRATLKRTISAATQKKLANGELHPLVISFDSKSCVFPLAISAINGQPSEISLYVLSSEPLMSRAIFDKEFAIYSRRRSERIKSDLLAREHYSAAALDGAFPQPQGAGPATRFRKGEDPGDPISRRVMSLLGSPVPEPSTPVDDTEFDVGRLVFAMQTEPHELKKTTGQLSRLAGRTWWLIKQDVVFAPDEMADLEFEPAIRILAERLNSADGRFAAICLPQFGARAIPVAIEAARNSDRFERRSAAWLLSRMRDPRFIAIIPDLINDPDPSIRCEACEASAMNWDAGFAPRLAELLSDSDGGVRAAATSVLREHPVSSQIPLYQRMVKEGGIAASEAIQLIDSKSFSRADWIQLFSSTNTRVVFEAFTRAGFSVTPQEVEPLLTNSLVMARNLGLAGLLRAGDKEAMDRLVLMLRDPDEFIRWKVRYDLRYITGQKLGSDPAAYEKWWAENRSTFALPTPARN